NQVLKTYWSPYLESGRSRRRKNVAVAFIQIRCRGCERRRTKKGGRRRKGSGRTNTAAKIAKKDTDIIVVDSAGGPIRVERRRR
ncbi:hypothetical protein V1477_010197, partial [Vespula maculifrons]